MSFQKQTPWRCDGYLQWIRTQPCCLTGQTKNVQAHHIISCGMGGSMGSKVSDLWSIPLSSEKHAMLHAFPSQSNLDQKAEALKMIEKAIKAGVLKFDSAGAFMDGLHD